MEDAEHQVCTASVEVSIIKASGVILALEFEDENDMRILFYMGGLPWHI